MKKANALLILVCILGMVIFACESNKLKSIKEKLPGGDIGEYRQTRIETNTERSHFRNVTAHFCDSPGHVAVNYKDKHDKESSIEVIIDLHPGNDPYLTHDLIGYMHFYSRKPGGDIIPYEVIGSGSSRHLRIIGQNQHHAAWLSNNYSIVINCKRITIYPQLLMERYLSAFPSTLDLEPITPEASFRSIENYWYQAEIPRRLAQIKGKSPVKGKRRSWSARSTGLAVLEEFVRRHVKLEQTKKGETLNFIINVDLAKQRIDSFEAEPDAMIQVWEKWWQANRESLTFINLDVP